MKRQNRKPSFDWSGHVILFFFSIARLCEWTTTEFAGRSKKKKMDSIFRYNKKWSKFFSNFIPKESFIFEWSSKKSSKLLLYLDFEYSIYTYISYIRILVYSTQELTKESVDSKLRDA